MNEETQAKLKEPDLLTQLKKETLLFSDRKKIESDYIQWKNKILTEKGINLADCVTNFLTYMRSKGYLNLEKVKNDIKLNKERVTWK